MAGHPGCWSLFDGFSGTIALSDCPVVYTLGLRHSTFPSRTGFETSPSHFRALPVPAHRASAHAEGLRLRGPARNSLDAARRIVFPRHTRGRRTRCKISELNTSPTHLHANASPPPHGWPTHGLDARRLATPYRAADSHRLLRAGFHRRSRMPHFFRSFNSPSSIVPPADELRRFARFADSNAHEGPLTVSLILQWAGTASG